MSCTYFLDPPRSFHSNDARRDDGGLRLTPSTDPGRVETPHGVTSFDIC
jgi:hypothetical protein